MILIITNKSDLTTDFVIIALQRLGYPFYRFNTEDLFSCINIDFDIKKNKYLIIDTILNKTIDLKKDISSVYFRRPMLPNAVEFNLNKDEKSFINKESYYILEGIYSVLKDKFWISKPDNIKIAENKLLQLQIAKDLGFSIPPTQLTNIKESQLSFVQHMPCIIKPIKTGLVEQNNKYIKVVYTNEINKEALQTNKSKFPIYIQKMVKKSEDIRVTVVGDKVFSASIKCDNPDIVDWRKLENCGMLFEYTELPEKIKYLCIQLTKEFKLEFGAIDLAIDDNGEYIFFEINPNGQWAWLDKNLNYNIANEIANLLFNGGKNV